MKQIPIKLGPLALLLTVVTICLVILATLTFTTARADRVMAEKYAETVATRTAIEVEGEKLLEQADKLCKGGGSLSELPGAKRTGDIYDVELEQDGYTLSIGLKAKKDTYRLMYWKLDREWEEDTNIGQLWNGQ